MLGLVFITPEDEWERTALFEYCLVQLTQTARECLVLRQFLDISHGVAAHVYILIIIIVI